MKPVHEEYGVTIDETLAAVIRQHLKRVLSNSTKKVSLNVAWTLMRTAAHVWQWTAEHGGLESMERLNKGTFRQLATQAYETVQLEGGTPMG